MVFSSSEMKNLPQYVGAPLTLDLSSLLNSYSFIIYFVFIVLRVAERLPGMWGYTMGRLEIHHHR